MSDRMRAVMRTMTGRGGVEFRRRTDGAVEIWRPALESERLRTYAGPQTRLAAIIPANEWASLIAAMSTPGEDGFSFNLALAFHTGGCAYDRDAHEHSATE